VADDLSCKGQLNIITTYLMPQELCWEMEQLNLGMLNNMESTVMEVESTLEQEIHMRKSKKLKHILIWERPPISQKMNKTQYGLKREYVYQKSSTYANLF
jgi:hypothetical protein